MKIQIAAALLLGLLLASPPVSAALFAFDDVPTAQFGVPDEETPQTFAYQCGGKSYCSYRDIQDLTTGGNSFLSSLSTTNDGIGMTVSRPGTYFDVWPPGETDRMLTVGNDPQRFDLFLADFDRDLVSFQAAMIPPPSLAVDDVERWIVLELWSENGAMGSLVSSQVVKPGDWLEGVENTFALAAGAGESFRSARFGWVRSDHPDCREDCFFADPPLANRGNADDIFVRAIPEPTAALCFALGLALVERNRRSRR